MTVQILTEAKDLLHEAIAKLKSIGHPLAEKLHGDATQLETEAAADAGKVAHDAQAAAAPVVAETEHDAQAVAEQAVADVKDLGGSTPPPAA